MKYRIEVDLSFNNESDGVNFLNYIESIKSKVHKPIDEYDNLVRIAKYFDDHYDDTDKTFEENIDFDDDIIVHNVDNDRWNDINLIHSNNKCRVNIDISFLKDEDAVDVLNYIDTIKNNSLFGNINEYEVIQKSTKHNCFHDEILNKRCKNIIQVNFSG